MRWHTGVSCAFAFVILTLTGAQVPVQAASKLSRLFKYDMLDARVTYLEKMIGPAKHVLSPDSEGFVPRQYQVEGCDVTAYADKGAVQAYSLRLTPKCNFNLGDFLGNGYGTTMGLTIATFGGGAFGSDMRVQADCAYLCGNAADPRVDFTWNGPHAANFLTVVLTVVLVDDGAIDAAQQWTTLMRQKEGDDYVLKTNFNCEDKYDADAVKDFARAQVTDITVGFYAPRDASYKAGCPK